MRCFEKIGGEIIPGLPVVTPKRGRPYVLLGKDVQHKVQGVSVAVEYGKKLELSDELMAQPMGNYNRLMSADVRLSWDDGCQLIPERQENANPDQEKILVLIGASSRLWHESMNKLEPKWRLLFPNAVKSQYEYSAPQANEIGAFILVELALGDQGCNMLTYSEHCLEVIPARKGGLFKAASEEKHIRHDKMLAKVWFDGSEFRNLLRICE